MAKSNIMPSEAASEADKGVKRLLAKPAIGAYITAGTQPSMNDDGLGMEAPCFNFLRLFGD
jgi:hypothetical protein